MADFIYSTSGAVHAFRMGDFLYDMSGKAVGRVSAERVYRFDGSYVGELFRNMVVNKPVGPRRNLPPVASPKNAEPPTLDSHRGGDSGGFTDVFPQLVEIP